MNAICASCGRQAILEVGPPNDRVALCLNCYVKLSRTVTDQNQMLQRESDRLETMMYEVTGLPVPPRLAPSPPNVHTGPVNVSNVHVRDSNIGVLNQGNLSMVDSCISVLADKGEKELTSAIANLTGAVIQNSEISAQQKNEIIELLSGIASEAVLPRSHRRPSVLKSLMESLATVIGTTSGLIMIWEKLKGILEAF